MLKLIYGWTLINLVNPVNPVKKNKIRTLIMSKDILVVGGGIAGIQSSLDLADMGFKVHMVEKLPSIGGKMAQLDKTFPTNDCAI